jgi:carboxymethylenebutenolidase
MKHRRLFVLPFVLVLALAPTLLPAAAPVAPAGGSVQSSTVTYVSGKDTVSAYLVVPEGKGPFPAVMVIHEWWGLNDWVKEAAGKLAQEGYAALAIDLYRGKVAATADEAHELMRGVPEDRAARDLRAAFAYLKGRKDVIPAKIGSVGWCMGGGYSLESAVLLPELSACVICYGRLVTDSASIAGINARVLGIFGGQDKGITRESVLGFEGDAKGMKKDVGVTIYPDAGHAFMNPNNAAGYREADARDAWARILAFFRNAFDNH